MAFNVRIFGYRGIVQMAPHHANHIFGNIPWLLYQPYEWSQVVATNGATPVATVAVPNDQSKFIRIEVPDGAAIRYEINASGRNVAAGNSSPRLSGVDNFPWSQGAVVSIVDQASFP